MTKRKIIQCHDAFVMQSVKRTTSTKEDFH